MRYYRKGKKEFPKIKAGAAPELKKIFAGIGSPEVTEFKPDPFQLKALEAIKSADCLVTVPTGSGKTWIAQQAIDDVYRMGGRSWYASPLKALSNEKFSEFQSIFGSENVGILTGDRKENTDAPIIVGTTEILRNQLYDSMNLAEDLQTDFVVLDEAHFLGDEDRGVVWEEIMIYLPQRIPLLLLSATIGNAGEISKWLSQLRSKPCRVIEQNDRPVPLCHLFLHPKGKLFPIFHNTLADKKPRLHKIIKEYIGNKHPAFMAPPRQLPPLGSILGVLRKYHLLPAIIFLKSRADCDKAIDLCMENLDVEHEDPERFNFRIEELIDQSPHLKNHRQLWHIRHLRVGSHHSGQLPTWKLFIEALMKEGYLDAVFATSTVAAGVNFPARTAVFLNTDRFNGREFLPLNPTEFHQMTGRAGRRGIDNIGFSLAIPGKFMDLKRVARLAQSPATNVESQIKINFSMVLNLLLSHTPEDIRTLLEKSFGSFSLKRRRSGSRFKKSKAVVMNDDLWKDFLRHINFLKDTDYVTENDRLTEDGKWAAYLRLDQPLLTAEALRLDVLPHSDPALLAAIIASFVNEAETTDRFRKDQIPDRLIKTFFHIKYALEPFIRFMEESDFSVRPIYFKPAVSVYMWASGKSWEYACLLSEMAEGHFSMLIYRTADNLRHLKTLGSVFPEVAKSASKAIDMIMRDPVVNF